MLERVEAKSYEIGSVGDADNAENPAFLLEFVIIERKLGERFRACHDIDSPG